MTLQIYDFLSDNQMFIPINLYFLIRKAYFRSEKLLRFVLFPYVCIR